MTKPTQPPSRTAEQFVVRFPDGMRDRIAEAAKANNRSMNAEIVARLEQSFGSDEPLDPKVAEAVATLTDVAMNMMRTMNDDEFQYYLDRAKRANWERMGVPPENMPEPPPAPDLTKRKPKK
ncbi:Arc family DNA-binding protein [Burkholderia glumae]|uniref:Arc family DNA-binding protein n=1 Tax=Burkholderia glumae TaxID=337 RepID=UPI002554AF23|nr:Arc family DNA-binding protein [Burkholderia glumae]